MTTIPDYPADDPSVIKPGYATSEFYTMLISQALALLALVAPGDWVNHASSWTQPLATVAGVVGTGFYIWSRGHVKATHLKTVGAVAAAAAETPAPVEAADPVVSLDHLAVAADDRPQGPALSPGDAAWLQ